MRVFAASTLTFVVSTMTFNKGDVVQLKSGSPLMTVAEARTSSGNVMCVWFDGNEKKQDYFAPESLQIYREPDWNAAE